MKTESWFVVLLMAFVLACFIGGYYLADYRSEIKSGKHDTSGGDGITKEMQDKKIQIEAQANAIEKLTDSIMLLSVQKGQIEIELNRKQSSLNDLMKISKSVRVIHDTPAIVSNCDSIIAEVEPYIIDNAKYKNVIDSLINAQATIIYKRDTMFMINETLADSLITKLSECHNRNVYLENKNQKQQKTKWIFGAIGFLIATVSHLLK